MADYLFVKLCVFLVCLQMVSSLGLKPLGEDWMDMLEKDEIGNQLVRDKRNHIEADFDDVDIPEQALSQDQFGELEFEIPSYRGQLHHVDKNT